MIRKLKIELKAFVDETDVLADLMVPAMLEYCGAVLTGEAGLATDEHFMSDNGITLHIVHTVED